MAAITVATKKYNMKYLKAIENKLVVEYAKDLSDAEITRILNPCVAGKKLIVLCKEYRDKGFLVASEIKQKVRLYKLTQ